MTSATLALSQAPNSNVLLDSEDDEILLTSCLAIAVLLDLSAAFDTVEHNILLEALTTLGPGGRVSKWFRSYLSGHSQRLLVCGCLWKEFDLNCGVAQGSCLGPLFTSVYHLYELVTRCRRKISSICPLLCRRYPTLRLFPPRR